MIRPLTEGISGLSDGTYYHEDDDELKQANLLARPKQIPATSEPLVLDSGIAYLRLPGAGRVCVSEQNLGKKLGGMNGWTQRHSTR